MRHALDRPLTSYYLLLGASTLLLTIGLMMVLSASSVRSFKIYDDSYHIFLRQLTWVLLALPIAFVVSRLPHRLIRGLAWPGILGALVLLALTRVPGMGVEVNGNTNWLDLGPVQIQPSELAKLAVVLWCADLYARKERLLGDWRHALIPMAPVTGAGRRPGRRPEGPRHRAGPARDRARDALGGRRAGAACSCWASAWSVCSCSGWPPPARSGSSG